MNRLPGLDALRGIAAIMVAAHHLVTVFGLELLPFTPQHCVELFFILSGFVMARTYEQRMRSGLTTFAFVEARYRRLILPMAIGSLIGLIWTLIYFGPIPGVIVSFIPIVFFLPAPWLASAYLLNIPAWSLFAEIACNACHPRLLANQSFGLLAGVAMVFGSIHLVGTFVGIVAWGPDFRSILTLLPSAFACYLLGVLIFRHYGDRPLGSHPILCIAAFPAALILISTYLPPALGEGLLLLLLAPLVIRGSLGLAEFRWAILIGTLSFPLYALHQPIMKMSVILDIGPVPAFCLALLAAGVVGALPGGGRLPARGTQRDGERQVAA